MEDEVDDVEDGEHKEGKLEDETGELEINEINLDDPIDFLLDEPI